MGSPQPSLPLLHALKNVILPRMEESVSSHTVIARRERKQLIIAEKFSVVPRTLQGERITIQNHKLFDRSVLLSARWPGDRLRELRIPKLMLVVAGRTGCRIGNYILQCPTGTAVFFPPGVPHTDGTVSHLESLPNEFQSCTLLWLTPVVSGLSCRMCHSRSEALCRDGQVPHENREYLFLTGPRLLQLFFMLSEESEEPAEISDVFANLFRAFLHSALQDIASERFLLSTAPPQETDHLLPQTDPIVQAMQYAATHYAEPLTLDSVAHRFLMSRAQFTRRFRERTGQSFIEYLNQQRLLQAEQLLQQTDWTVAMISRRVGFRSPAHFHTLFTRRNSLSPIAFRKQAKKL